MVYRCVHQSLGQIASTGLPTVDNAASNVTLTVPVTGSTGAPDSKFVKSKLYVCKAGFAKAPHQPNTIAAAARQLRSLDQLVRSKQTRRITP
jgi:hypothetical protein